MRAERSHLTDAAIQRLRPPQSGYLVRYDSLSPLGLRVNAGARTSGSYRLLNPACIASRSFRV
jgi:hypothetical protein